MTNQELMSAMQQAGRLHIVSVGDAPKPKKISIAKLRRILSVGAQFTAEFIGINAKIAKPDLVRTYRTVRKQNAQNMVSTIDNDAEIPGTEVWLNWKGVTAEQHGEVIVLTMNEVNPPEHFLRILPIDNREN